MNRVPGGTKPPFAVSWDGVLLEAAICVVPVAVQTTPPPGVVRRAGICEDLKGKYHSGRYCGRGT